MLAAAVQCIALERSHQLVALVLLQGRVCQLDGLLQATKKGGRGTEGRPARFQLVGSRRQGGRRRVGAAAALAVLPLTPSPVPLLPRGTHLVGAGVQGVIQGPQLALIVFISVQRHCGTLLDIVAASYDAEIKVAASGAAFPASSHNTAICCMPGACRVPPTRPAFNQSRIESERPGAHRGCKLSHSTRVHGSEVSGRHQACGMSNRGETMVNGSVDVSGKI